MIETEENRFMKPGIITTAGIKFIEARKYEILLASFLLLIFGNTFYIVTFSGNALFIFQNMIIGMIIFFNHKILRRILITLNITHFAVTILSLRYSIVDDIHLKGVIYLLYFSVVSIEVYRKIFYTVSVSRELVAAVLCGFILLCLIATFVFMEVEVHHHNSFSNVGEGKNRLANLNYFSFVTVLTIGYGDMIPLSFIAKRAVMFIGLCGHFYTVFVTGIVIGKYINKNNFNRNAAQKVLEKEVGSKALLHRF
ncbi:MAG: hypothetical protein JWQ09_3298 [Segetibacter sp.]|nr:hypothetical protein [Segetibacter sp.]